jgi:N-6 DNA Methylase
LPKEQFLYAETKPVFDLIEETSRRSGVSRAQAFEDFLHMSVCALSGGQMEDQYMATVKRHTEGKPGKRGCDSISQAFATLVHHMEETRQDILGDLFQGSITYGEAGQYMTPEPVCQMMASMTVGDVAEEEGSARKNVCDPCCGSGRMLLAVADLKPHWEFVGQDVDLRCVRMTAINLALRNLYGYVVWGNSLGLEKRLVYRTGFNLRGVIRELPLTDCPAPIQQMAAEPAPEPSLSSPEPTDVISSTDEPPRPPGKQLRLF